MFGFLKSLFTKQSTIDDTARDLIARMKVLWPNVEYAYEPSIGFIKGSDGAVISLQNLQVNLSRASANERAVTIEKFQRDAGTHIS